MAFVLYDVLPTEIVWEIEKQKQKLCMKDVVEEYNTINNFIKRNTEDSYYSWLFEFAKNKNAMWEETHSDEELVEIYSELFTDGFSEEKKQLLYEDMYDNFDNYQFQEDYSDKLYSSYDEFRTGDWSVEEFWWGVGWWNAEFQQDSSDEDDWDGGIGNICLSATKNKWVM